MGIIDRIERLQQSSLSVRRTILAITVVVIMTAVIGIWVMQLEYELQEDTAAPSLADSFGSVWSNIKEKAPKLSK